MRIDTKPVLKYFYRKLNNYIPMWEYELFMNEVYYIKMEKYNG